MRSKKTYIPLWKNIWTEAFKARIIHDSLLWGLYDLPPLEQIPDLTNNLLTGNNIFSSIPFIRNIENKRLCIIGNKIYVIYNLRSAESKKEVINCVEKNEYLFVNFFEYFKCENVYRLNYYQKFNELSDIVSFIPEGYSVCYLSSDIVFHYFYVFYKKNGSFSSDRLPWEQNRIYDCNYFAVMSEIPSDIAKLVTDIPQIDISEKVQSLLSYDNTRAQLPVLDKAYAQDKTLGVWDAFWPDGVQADPNWYFPATLDEECEAADPWDAVREDSFVCIDFGTSSTVAAVREADGDIHLLKIGGDYSTQNRPNEYENPTALEFSNYQEMLFSWKHEPWRPLISWKDIKCSHQAKNELSKGSSSHCGIRNIKTWARARPGQPPLHVVDEKNQAFDLVPLPVEAELNGIGDFDSRPVDPIELYAYYVGLALNNQSVFGGRIYCNYCMTFPVKFSREVRQRILQGFYRGLLRSMPLSLVSSKRWKENCPFTLTEQASEPTAFAASVLPHLGISPTEVGVPFGVFDFGGGTTDFAFGLYRTATKEEQATEGWEQVLEMFDVSGDENLGGEHLLDLLAYVIIRDKCAYEEESKRLPDGVTFVCPVGLQPFTGSEFIFVNSKEAYANTVMLREALRPLWEEGSLSDEGTGQISVTLQTNKSKSSNVSFTVDQKALRDVLKSRIREGVLAFFSTFRQAFNTHFGQLENLQELHILLAGNSCRSILVREVFEDVITSEVVPNESDAVKVHYEMIPVSENGEKGDVEETKMDADSTVAPTLKTGVALGLLRLLPGEPTGIVECNSTEESPFLFSVGSFVNGTLIPVLSRNAEYGTWRVFGNVFRNGWTLWGYSNSALAMEKQVSRTQCTERKINWGSGNFGRTILVKAVAPNEIAFALAEAEEDSCVTADESTLHTFSLKA